MVRIGVHRKIHSLSAGAWHSLQAPPMGQQFTAPTVRQLISDFHKPLSCYRYEHDLNVDGLVIGVTSAARVVRSARLTPREPPGSGLLLYPRAPVGAGQPLQEAAMDHPIPPDDDKGVHVREYVRTRFGRREDVREHWRFGRRSE